MIQNYLKIQLLNEKHFFKIVHYKNIGGFLNSIFAALNIDEVFLILNRKLLFPPIGVQKNDNAQQCKFLESEILVFVIFNSFKSKLAVELIFQRLVKLISQVATSV
jgi:hypothetical protein